MELTIHVENGAIVEDGLQYVMNAWDENAVEAAVQLKENSNAETTLVSIGGGEENTKMIRKGFAMGIENGIQIDDPVLVDECLANLVHDLGFAKVGAGDAQFGRVDILGQSRPRLFQDLAERLLCRGDRFQQAASSKESVIKVDRRIAEKDVS